ncbi:glycosyltransferase [Paraflavitalea speifideaquila]|uniref:glycosyltransferase n=1 Tax=Paraflavitalea speifideaquila TaxID=3076558 RepID=UPI0028E43419|nr:glycosyltransferase [Paraflavitalea speifideiaquila]
MPFFHHQRTGRSLVQEEKAFPQSTAHYGRRYFFNYATRDAGRKEVYHNRAAARIQTRMQGQPVFLWVGRLDANKDPLTILAGLATVFEKYPAARLYMIYNNDQLLSQVKEHIHTNAILQNRVHLLGAIPHEQVEAYYHSADYFVLGSHYEGSGYALSEALRCGCIPIITNIPSFQIMTKDGQLGALWQPGNRQHFIEAVITAMQKPLEQEAHACIRFYQQQLSFEAIARVAATHYQQVHQARIQKINQPGRPH